MRLTFAHSDGLRPRGAGSYDSAMFGLGIWELLILLVIVLVLFSRRLPEVGEGLAKAIRKFRGTMREPDEIDVTPGADQEEEKKEDGPS